MKQQYHTLQLSYGSSKKETEDFSVRQAARRAGKAVGGAVSGAVNYVEREANRAADTVGGAVGGAVNYVEREANRAADTITTAGQQAVNYVEREANRAIRTVDGVLQKMHVDCDSCAHLPILDVDICLQTVIREIANLIVKSAPEILQQQCVAMINSIIQIVALPNLSTGIGAILEVVLNPLVVGEICGMILGRIELLATEEGQNQLVDILVTHMCRLFK
jgi:hypothetical protein